MRNLSRMRVWLAALLTFLVLIPVLYLYDTWTTPAKTEQISRDFQLFAEQNQLSTDILHLVSSARSYMLNAEERHLHDFDDYSIKIIKTETDIYSRYDQGDVAEEWKKIIDLTEAFIFSFRNEVVPLMQEGGNYREVYLQKCEPLAVELEAACRDFLNDRNDALAREVAGVSAVGNSIKYFSYFLITVSLVLLVSGMRKIVYPMLVQQHYLENIAELSSDAMVVINKRGEISAINRAAEKLLELKSSEAEGHSLNKVMVSHPTVQVLLQPLLNVVLKGTGLKSDQMVFDSGGRRVFLNVDYHPLFFMGRLTGAVMRVHPVEIHKDKRYLFSAIEAERKKVSIEIHDWVGRNMSAIIHALDYTIRARAGKIPPDLQEELVQLRSRCQGAAMDMRGIMNDIHPYLIDRVGLLSALESHVDRFEQVHGIKVYIFYRERDLKLDKTEEITVFRIVQEALTNVAKHSNASEVDIYFKDAGGALKVEITDNGRPPGEIVMGNGLWGMKERANLIGGDLVYSAGGSGFTVTLTMPRAAEENVDEPNKDNAG